MGTPWKMSHEREAFVMFASVVLKFGLVAILLAFGMLGLGALRGTATTIVAAVAWVIALLVVRRIAEGPNRRQMLRRARRRFLDQRRGDSRMLTRGDCAASTHSSRGSAVAG